MDKNTIPLESIIILHNNLVGLSARNPEKRRLQEEVAKGFDVSLSTIRRVLRNYRKPKSARRSDFNHPRVISAAEMQYYCDLIAALKKRTTNKQDRHLSTPTALWILENHGIGVDGNIVIAPKNVLKKSTVNRHLKRFGFSPKGLLLEPTVVHFQAEQSNEFWQMDFTPSELKKLPQSDDSMSSKLMLASIVDDRSGVLYQEYFVSDGESALMALQFLFNAMAPKKQKNFPFQGIPKAMYLDNGPVAKSLLFQRVVEQLGIKILTHLPKGSDGQRTTARSKGKVERPFRTVQEAFETFYHFHKPQTLEEANEWLWVYLDRYNAMPHRSEKQTRLEDWKKNLPPEGYQKTCSRERFSQMARQPSERSVGSDACITLEGISYQLKAEMAGEKVMVLIGVFDSEIYVDFQNKKEGPFYPAAGPIPLHTYRSFKKTHQEKKLDEISDLAKRITLPRSVLSGRKEDIHLLEQSNLFEEKPLVFTPFRDTEIEELSYFATPLEAKLAIACHLGRPLATLLVEQRQEIDGFITQTLHKETLLNKVRDYFKPRLYQSGGG